jgi:hypothetical protein
LTAVFSSSQQRWLEISLRVSGSTGPFTTLSPRQAVGSSPQAMFALNAGAHNHGAGDITSGTVSPARGGLGSDLSGAAAGSLLYASAPGMWSVLSPGNNGQLVGMTDSGLLGWANVLSVLQAGPGIVLDPPDLNTDPSGRVKVRFHWDSSGIADQESTWSRVQHFPAGVRYGINFLPEINDEVLVTFLNGNPDRPLVVGQLFNNPDNPARHGPSRKIKAGDATGPNRDGGSIFIEPGRGTGTGTDGSVTLSSPVEIRFVPQGASLWARHSEDTVQLQAELVAPAGDRPGQSVEIRASDAAGANRNGGDIVLQPGVATGAGAPGRVRIMGDLALPTSGITGGGAASGLDADALDGFSWHDHPLFRGLNLTDWAAPGPAGGGFPGLRLRGTLSDLQGAPREGLVTMTVRIYSVATGGTPLYAEQFTVLLAAGVVDLVLGVGSGTATGDLAAALTPAAGQPPERYLTLQVAGEAQELMPRRRVTAGAYAIVALNAQSLGGQSASAYVARIDLDAEVAARVAADAALQAALDAEVAARIAGDAAAVTSARTYTDTAIASETAARVAADTTLQTALDALDAAVASEVTARIAGDTAAVASAKTYTDGAVASEAAARIAGDAAAVTTARTHTDTAIASEVAARIAADTSLQTALDAEVAARVAGNAAAVATARTYTDDQIASEAAARAAADATLQGNLDIHKTSGDHDGRYARLDAANSFTALQDFQAGLRLDTAEIQAGPPAPEENRIRYTLFKEDGTPLRAEINVTIQNVSAREMPLSSSVQYRIACTGADDQGPHFLLTAGDGAGTDKNGGHTILEGGSPTGAGTAGSVIARQNAVGAVNAPIFAVQNSSGAATYLQVAGSGQVSWSGTAQGSIAGNAATATTAGTATTLASGTHTGQYTFDNTANIFIATTTFQTREPSSTPLVVQGAASQTASLQEWRNSAGVSVASVSSSGTFMGDGSGLTSLTASALANNTSYNIGTGTFQAGTLSGTHSGNGSGLTGVTAATLADGTHSGQYTFNNAANSFAGTHSGDGAGLTGVTPADNSVSTAKLQDGCVTGAKLSAAGCTAGQVWKFNGTGWTCADDNDTTYSAGAGLNLSGTTFSLADGGVTTAKLADAAVTGAKLASTLTVSGALTLATSGNGNSLTLQTAAGANSTENVSVTADENIQLTAVNGAITVNKPVTGAAAKAGTASAAGTPSVANLTVLRLDGYSVPTTITDLLDGVDGQTLVIVAGNNALPVIVSDNDSPTPGNFRLRGNLIWQAMPNHTLSLCRMNGIWFETGRSEN